MIGCELESEARPSEEALAVGAMLAAVGATTEIVGRLLAEAHRKRPNERMVHAYAFMLEAALGTLRLEASGGDIGADRAIAEVRERLDRHLVDRCTLGLTQHGNHHVLLGGALRVGLRLGIRQGLDCRPQLIDQRGGNPSHSLFIARHPQQLRRLDLQNRRHRPSAS